MKRLALILALVWCASAHAACIPSTLTNKAALGCKPLAVSPSSSDYLVLWQPNLSGSTRLMSFDQMAAKFLSLSSGGTVTGDLALNGKTLSTITTDTSEDSSDNRYNMFQTNISIAADTSNIWENFNSFITLDGPDTANGEINLMHTYLQVNSGADAEQAEGFESSMENLGTVNKFDNILAIQHNGSAGMATGLFGPVFELTNDNTTAASVVTYAAIDCETMLGDGSAPSFNYCIRNADPSGVIATSGKVKIGDLSPPPRCLAGNSRAGQAREHCRSEDR